MSRFDAGRTIGIRRFKADAQDSRGNKVDAWEAPVPSSGWAIAFSPSSTEPATPDAVEAVAIPVTLYGPFDAQITARDRVVVDGKVYEVEGEVARWHNAHTGQRPGCVVTAIRKEGR